jgi:hypothetical protein
MDGLVIAAFVGAFGTVAAGAIGAIASVKAARAAGHINRKVETNHGGTIGEHMEDLLDWAIMHQEMDNDTREALGLPRIEIPVVRRRHISE